MMWYKFAQLQIKPYYTLSYIYLCFAIIISFAEFLPERIKFRIKIMAHIPLSMRDSLFLHLLIGASFVALLSLFLSCSIALILSSYYPSDIVSLSIKDTLAYSFAAIVLYISLSSVILEKNIKVFVFKVLIMLFFVLLFVKTRYFVQDSLWLAFLFVIPFVALDSFYSIKEQRLTSTLYKISLVVVTLSFIYLSYTSYKSNYKKSFTHFYIFLLKCNKQLHIPKKLCRSSF